MISYVYLYSKFDGPIYAQFPSSKFRAYLMALLEGDRGDVIMLHDDWGFLRSHEWGVEFFVATHLWRRNFAFAEVSHEGNPHPRLFIHGWMQNLTLPEAIQYRTNEKIKEYSTGFEVIEGLSDNMFPANSLDDTFELRAAWAIFRHIRLGQKFGHSPDIKLVENQIKYHMSSYMREIEDLLRASAPLVAKELGPELCYQVVDLSGEEEAMVNLKFMTCTCREFPAAQQQEQHCKHQIAALRDSGFLKKHWAIPDSVFQQAQKRPVAFFYDE